MYRCPRVDKTGGQRSLGGGFLLVAEAIWDRVYQCSMALKTMLLTNSSERGKDCDTV